ncbi:hypothetical protein M3Y94_00977700 [Aphelenchoides besseyi]|nr:hypothetical protein M3Y94_00977700 [Aphelenchoides besseyi]
MQRIFVLFLILPFCDATTECIWATGVLECRKNQTRVIGSVVQIYDLDSPINSPFKNPLDHDDLAGISIVDSETGLWNVEGCASDQDYLFYKNRPEFYITVKHNCNGKPQTLQVPGVFRVYVPETYAKHINEPIVLDDNYEATKDDAIGYEVIDISGKNGQIDRTIEIADEQLDR